MAVAVVFSFGISFIAYRGISGSTTVNIAINVIQISALLVFAVLALGYRLNHAPGSVAYQFDSQTSAAYSCEFATTKAIVNGQATDTIVRASDGSPQCAADASGKPVPYRITYPVNDSSGNFLTHPNGKSVVRMHNFGWMLVGNLDGRRGEERQARCSDRSDYLIAGARSVLLSVSILLRELLP